MRRFTTLSALAGLIPLIAACGLAGRAGVTEGPTTVAADGLPGQIEAVHAAAVGKDQAVFWVSSNGCTTKSDLVPVVRASGDGSVITLRRVKDDACRQVRPEGVELSWTFEEMGLAPGARVSIENPYQMPKT